MNRTDFTNNISIRQDGFSDLFEEIFEGNSVHIEIDNRITTCKKDIEVCCKKTSPIRTTTRPTTTRTTARPTTKSTTTQRPTPLPPPKVPKCGMHHAEGIEITASDPSNGKAK